MPKAISPSRDALALVEARVLADEGMDVELRALLGWTCRETRRITPACPALIRGMQAIAVRSLAKALSGDPSLAVLNRTLSELMKGAKVLGIPLPDGQTVARRTPRAQPRRESSDGYLIPERVGGHRTRRPAPVDEEDLGDDDGQVEDGDDGQVEDDQGVGGDPQIGAGDDDG